MLSQYAWQDDPVSPDDALAHAVSLSEIDENAVAYELYLLESDEGDTEYVALTAAQQMMLGIPVGDW